MATKWLNDFLRSMFEQYQPGKIPHAGLLPKADPTAEPNAPQSRLPEDDARRPDVMPEPLVPAPTPADSRHTYLFEEGVWLVGGVYINERSVSVDVEGESVISHRESRWFNEVSMELKLEDNGQYRNLENKTVYECAPIESILDASQWHGSNSLLGRLYGVLVFVDDTILSTYKAASGNIRGMESLRRISEYEYQCRGALFEGGKRSSSWILRYDKG